jgi:hypothetical protein
LIKQERFEGFYLKFSHFAFLEITLQKTDRIQIKIFRSARTLRNRLMSPLNLRHTQKKQKSNKCALMCINTGI